MNETCHQIYAWVSVHEKVTGRALSPFKRERGLLLKQSVSILQNSKKAFNPMGVAKILGPYQPIIA